MKKSSSPFGIVFDIDGVLKRGEQVIPGAVETLNILQQHNIPFVFVSNTCGYLESDKAHELTNLFQNKFLFDSKKMILSHTPMKNLTLEFKDKKVLLVGVKESSLQIAKEYGFQNVITSEDYIASHSFLIPANKYIHRGDIVEEPIEAILILKVPKNWEATIQIICDIVRYNGLVTYHTTHCQKKQPNDIQKVKVFLSNPDIVYQDEFCEPRITLGAFFLCVKTLYQTLTNSSLLYESFGKPFKPIYDYTHQVLSNYSSNIERIYAIGDNPKSDIKGANDAGEKWISILTRTGCFREGENDLEHPAKKVVQDVNEAVKWIFDMENLNI